MARIAVGGFQHETNSFVPGRTDFAYFQSHRDRPPLVRGEDLFAWMVDTSVAMSGFVQAMRGRHELLPLVWASGGAGPVVTGEAFERIVCELVGRLSLAMPVDAVYLDLHGAMVTEAFEDGEGELLRRVRAVVGDVVPVVISLDYHANVTLDMVELCDGMVGYLTYPHVDRKETGGRAASVLDAALRRGRPQGRALRKAPFLISLNFQCTTLEPSKSVVRQAEAARHDELLSLAYLAGFPPADLFYCGPSVVAYAYSQGVADDFADQLMRTMALKEAEFAQPLLEPDEAVRTAMAIAAASDKPVILADTQDNPGCGGTGDTTGVLAALVRAKAQAAVVGILHDAEAASAAHRAGIGAKLNIALGGRSGPEGVVPLTANYRVSRLGSGRMRTTGPAVGNRDIDLGPMALLSLDGVSIVVSSKRVQAYDQAPFRHLGVDPAAQKILALKSTVHFRAHFEPIAERVLVVLAPGAHLVDATRYPYRNLRRGVRLHPLGPPFEPPGARVMARGPATSRV
jgi:microcystin degradation protein MlrC